MGNSERVLRVDLSTGRIAVEEVSPQVIRKWVGGTGLGVHYLYQEVPPHVQWDSPDNRVILATGPLAGTRVSGTGTFSAVFKGPMTNLAGATQANGYFGAFLRSQGYYAIVLQGAADRPTHLHIDDDGVTLRDATHLSGLGTWALEDRVREEFGVSDKQMSVFGIGPAGEHLVRFAALVGDRGHVAAHNGIGAVLGAKKLKVISVRRGKIKPPVAHPGRLNELAEALFTHARDDAGGSIYRWGTAGNVPGCALGGWLPVKNYTTNIYPEYEKMSGQYIRTHFKHKPNPCWACRLACCHTMEVTEGPYKGYSAEEPEYEGMAAMGPQIGVTEPGSAVMLCGECDDLGMDINEIGWVLGWVIECFEQGILSSADLDGIAPRWGDAEAARTLMHKIARREGCGEWLAEGVMRASQRVGGAAAEMAIYTLKGNTPRTHDHRARWPEMFDTCMSSTGTIETSFGGLKTERLGLPPLKDRFSPDQIVEHMAQLYGWHQFEDSLGVCRTDFTNADLGVQATNAVTGWELTLQDALIIGRRISTQLRVWSFLHGMDPSLERPSARYGSVPVDGPAAGADIMPHWDRMVRRYRELIGWTPDTGLPLPETLEALDLAELVPLVKALAERGLPVAP